MRQRLATHISCAVLLGFLALAPHLLAQQQTPSRIGYVFPAGGRQGTTVDAVVGGQRMEGASEVRISGTGVRATLGELDKPLNPKQLNELRDQVRELVDKRRASFGAQPAGTQPSGRSKWTAADEKLLEELVQKLKDANGRRQKSPALAETIPLHITIDRNAAPGPREVRLLTATGLTDPLTFYVGQLPEFTATPYSPIKVGRDGQPMEMSITAISVPDAQPVKPLTLPIVVNGQILPGGTDRIRFTASQGMHLVVQTSARAIMPFLSDAVPGWFQAAVAIEDEQGREIAFADHYRYDPDPIFCCDIPRDGTYILKVRDSIYRGREDFVYRVTLGELPYITGIFPLGAHGGSSTQVQLMGWNLPTEKIMVDTSDRLSGRVPISVSKGGISSNTLLFAVDMLPECRERLPNNSMSTAQHVMLPIVINGAVEEPGAWHVFRFEGYTNQKIVAEVSGRRLGSPLDSVIKLTDAKGKVLAISDDQRDQAASTQTQDADSYISATLPAGGFYYLFLADLQQQSGPEYAFRLRISNPRPDFELRVAPAELDIRAGTSVPLTVYAIRKDGFTGEIALSLTKAPAGFVLTGGNIPAKENEIKLTLQAPPSMLEEPATLSLEGRAMIAGQNVSHVAIPVEDMMQAFAYHHLVPSREWLVSVPPQPIARAAIKILSPTPLRFSGKGSALVSASLPPVTHMGKVQVELSDPPEGVSIVETSMQDSGNVNIMLKYDASKMTPGYKGNLIFNVFVEREPRAAASPLARKRRVPLGSMPAVPFEIKP